MRVLTGAPVHRQEVPGLSNWSPFIARRSIGAGPTERFELVPQQKALWRDNRVRAEGLTDLQGQYVVVAMDMPNTGLPAVTAGAAGATAPLATAVGAACAAAWSVWAAQW